MPIQERPILEKLPDAPIELGLRFVDPTKDQISELETSLEKVAYLLHEKHDKLVLPEKGVLVEPLDSRKKRAIDEQLDPIYSQYFMRLQDTAGSIDVIESGEKMVDLTNMLPKVDVRVSFSDRKELSNIPKIFWAREAVAELLVKAGKAWNSLGLMPHFEDAFRPLGVQESGFQKVIDLISTQNPNWNSDQLVAGARSKVAVAPFLAGHKAGAATDITLRYFDGKPADIGNRYLEMGASVVFSFPYLTWEQFKMRQIFASTAKMAGIVVYPGESWHISAYDVCATIAVEDPLSYPIKYGPIRGFNPQNGQIEPYDPAEYYKTFDFVIKKT